MSSQYCSVLPKFSDLMSNRLLYNEFVNAECLTKDNCQDLEESLYDELEEVVCCHNGETRKSILAFGSYGIRKVFSDHILVGKRFQKTLYRGHIEDLDDDTNHPPIALTDLALKLFSKAVPNYGLDQLDMDYVSSVSEATSVSPCAMILALIYLERLQVKNSDYLESVSPSGLFVVTMLVASKFLFENEEDIVTNQIWSEALNIDVKELNQLEQNFLSAIDWRLYVDSYEYYEYLSNVEKMIALKQSSLRGWLSYSDAYSILQDAIIKKLFLSYIESIIKVFAVSALSYAVTVFSVYTASVAIQSRHNEYHTSVPRNNIQMKSDVQNFLPIFTNVEHESDMKFIDSVLDDSSAVFSGLSLNNQNTFNQENNYFNYLYENTHRETLLDYDKHSTSTYGHSSSAPKVESKYDFYIYNNSFFMDLMNEALYKLQWAPSGFKNICISVLVQ